MLIGKDSVNCETVGELIEELNKFDKKAALECDLEFGVNVCAMFDAETYEFAYVNISSGTGEG